MAPAVPFALLGAVQLTAVAAWLGLAGAVSFPRLRRRVTPVFVVGALLVAAADAVTPLQYGDASSDALGWLRIAGFALLAIGALGGTAQSLVVGTAGPAGVVVPLGAKPLPSLVGGAVALVAAVAAWTRGLRAGGDRALGALLGAAFAFHGLAAALAETARDSASGALAVVAARGAGTVFLVVALVLLARLLLVGKIVGAILAGVVAMAVGAVAVVGTAVADEVQSQQSERLLQVAASEQAALSTLASRAALFAQIVAHCPGQRTGCESFLTLFSDQPAYFAVIVRRGHGVVQIEPRQPVLSNAALVQLAGSPIVRSALAPDATVQTAANGSLVLSGSPAKLVVVAAVPGRRPGQPVDTRVPPSFAAVYGVVVDDAYLGSAQRPPGYDETVIAGGRVLASSLGTVGRAAVLAEARAAGVESADPSVRRVVPADNARPTVALVPVTAAGNDDVRIATLALSQPANEALRAQRAVLRKLFLTALIALIVVALLAVALAQRVADPVRRLTVAAGRVRRGDLDTTIGSRSPDEVGRLARAFDAMTASLRQATADLRSTAEQEAAVRARLQTVVESMSDGLVVTDTSGVVTDANPTAVALLGVAAADIVGRPVGEVVRLVDGDGRPLALRPRAGTIDGDLVCTGERERVPVRAGIAPLGDGQGSVVVLADRTREHEVERMKTEFLANISHELRTPLTPIRGYAEILARRTDLGRPQVETFLKEILTSTERMSRAVELLVDVAALEGGRVVPDRQRVPVRAFVDQRLAEWKAKYPSRASDFSRRVATKLPALDIDRRWVERALDEFADNAVKYTEPGTPIAVTATLADDGASVRLAVRDRGPGFDPQRAAELVGDFSQADASETRRVGGLGLGLGFVNRVAERFGLEFDVSSTPGHGSEFALLLPAAER